VKSEVNKIKMGTRGDLFVCVLEINSDEKHGIFAHELQRFIEADGGVLRTFIVNCNKSVISVYRIHPLYLKL